MTHIIVLPGSFIKKKMRKMKFIPFLLTLSLIISGCASAEKHYPEELEPYLDIELKYPIVMVHGIGRNDRGEHVKSWNNIPDVMRHNGLEVYYGNTDAWGNIATNSELLKTTIDTILDETNCEKVNIIAHSKGGIDSRYMIWKYQYGDKVASLTTIATPHYGSEIADFLFNSKIMHRKQMKRRLNVLGKLYGDVHPNMYEVNSELTTENMKEFSESVTIDSNVYYQSIYSVMSEPSDDPFLARTNRYIKNKNMDNDGLVSEQSAQWGPHIKKLPDSISHEQIIGYGGKKIHGMKIPIIYLEMAQELGELGF